MAQTKAKSKTTTTPTKKRSRKAKVKPTPKPVAELKGKTSVKATRQASHKLIVKARGRANIKTTRRPKLKFKTGDHVVYPTHGVGLVQGVENETIAGHDLNLVVVTFNNERMTLRVPTDKMEASGLRELSSRKVMDDAISTLKGRARVKRTMWSRRAQEYEAKINSGDPLYIAEVVRDLHRNVGQPDQSFSERQIYELALERLASEVAAVDGINREEATEKLEQILGTT